MCFCLVLLGCGFRTGFSKAPQREQVASGKIDTTIHTVPALAAGLADIVGAERRAVLAHVLVQRTRVEVRLRMERVGADELAQLIVGVG